MIASRFVCKVKVEHVVGGCVMVCKVKAEHVLGDCVMVCL